MGAQVVPFPRSSQEQEHQEYKASHEVLRELRVSRGWSYTDVARAIMSCATGDEKKSLPDLESLRRSWRRWESGKVEPDGSLHRKPFFKPIIARAFGVEPGRIWPASSLTTTTSVAPSAGLAEFTELRARLAARRDRLRQELAYLDAVLAVPVPESM